MKTIEELYVEEVYIEEIHIQYISLSYRKAIEEIFTLYAVYIKHYT